ncbi:MAG: hypothetical protein PHQ23_12220 [Candidatus Wallbacteria bacterium]|nr:hypothetical protein [Candidatus Wallbacteria bacterium]
MFSDFIGISDYHLHRDVTVEVGYTTRKRHALTVKIAPDEELRASGTWRIPGYHDVLGLDTWRRGGESIDIAENTTYEIEFKRLDGFIEPQRTSRHMADTTDEVTFAYTRIEPMSTHYLTVSFNPEGIEEQGARFRTIRPEVSNWKLPCPVMINEGQEYELEFKGTTDWQAPDNIRGRMGLEDQDVVAVFSNKQTYILYTGTKTNHAKVFAMNPDDSSPLRLMDSERYIMQGYSSGTISHDGKRLLTSVGYPIGGWMNYYGFLESNSDSTNPFFPYFVNPAAELYIAVRIKPSFFGQRYPGRVQLVGIVC